LVKLLADENVHAVVIARLRAKGFDVEAIAETAPGMSDADILARGDIAGLVLVTYDRDFGDLIFNGNKPTPRILIYSRLGRAEPVYVADRIADVVSDSPKDGHCYFISKSGVRPRPFSSGSMIDA